MASRTEAYADTSAFIAFLDRSDSHHPLFRRLFSDPPTLVTSTLVIAEGQGWFLRRYDARKAVEFLRFIQELAPLTVVPFGPEDLAAATAMLGKFGDQRLTLADTHGLMLMKRRRIRSCWSTDRHLGLTGVPLVV
jgi:predicted nucleic acid-binding protein